MSVELEKIDMAQHGSHQEKKNMYQTISVSMEIKIVFVIRQKHQQFSLSTLLLFDY